MPDFELEDMHDGPVFGLDEVGRGPLAGPVVAACVYIPQHARKLAFISELKDSKKISKPKLEVLYGLITQHCEWQVAEISSAEVDEINVLQASLKGMCIACNSMATEPAFALVDGNRMPKELCCNAQTVVKGDNKSYSIAAASIVAKVTRDRIMKALHQEHPHYGWDSNAGYPSPAHLEGIDAHGITDHHRKSYAPIKNYLEFGMTRQASKTAG
jgi:ribonuclease HII